jgi:hypothetical protein
MPVTVHEVPEMGRHFDLKADATARALVAKLAGLRSLPRLEASLDVTRRGTDRLRVVGEVSATVGQTCVISLDPIENEISEPVDLVFAPPADPDGAPEALKEMEISADAPEPMLNETIDLAALAIEFMILGIDPYPRAPEAVFEMRQVEPEAAHPFDSLAKLQGGRDRGKG